ncbi:hydrogenase nickel incorporation protein HypB [Geothermobacter ehrlichii]|uniref:Hydrogenase nickel incorporation protein HypB n=1 Tax=Geothermobacter ehrlichii TaxID=213224 RepID=A0A5D3WGJ6_9BACT|nr:hydrogenase nickel incorporation protein HypB [Geothermobacter ehrlichii]TYO96644.1 hydrogenase nickel incorporation protein HypB [Geothermobacter ehrlichii]
MCIDCGCSERTGQAHHHHDHDHDHDGRTIRVEENLLAKNDRLAAANRVRFTRHGLLTLNLVSSPGSGKTTLLETTLRALKDELRFAVLEGDQQTSNDADRIAATGVPAHQINTGAGCHLDAHMVAHGVDHFDLDNLDVLLIENVGNLVCPASFDLGEDSKVTVLSITEGEDKPLKYPQMFRAAAIVIVNKIDLLPHLDFDLDQCRQFIRQVNPQARIFELSCRSGAGMDAWYDWLRAQVAAKRQQAQS